MRKKTGFPRAKYRQQRRRFIRANLPALLGLTCLVLAIAIAERLFLHGYWLGLFQGVVLTGWIAAMVTLFHVTTGSQNQLSGAWGEDNTYDVLRKAKRRGVIWGWVDSLAIESGDVDHIVVTKRAGIIAIDSKWHVALRSDTIDRDRASAASAARRARLILYSVGHRVAVAPMVVIWGGAQSDDELVNRCPGDVSAGGDLYTRLRSLTGTEISRDLARSVLRDLEGHGRRVKPVPSFGPLRHGPRARQPARSA